MTFSDLPVQFRYHQGVAELNEDLMLVKRTNKEQETYIRFVVLAFQILG